MSRARVLWHYAAARRRTFADRGALERWQRKRLSAVVRQAPRRYPYYAGMDLRELTDLPVVDKAEVLTRFADLTTANISLADCLAAARAAEAGREFGTTIGGLSVGLSSGTSGQQTAFLTSPAERDRWAGELLARALPNGLRAGARVTLVLRAGGPLYETVDGGRVSFRFVDLALPVDELLEQVRRSAPTILVGPPSILVMIARAELGLRLSRVFSGAEVLDPHDARVIEAGLGVPVDQIYQAAEGFLGMTCAAGTLHLAEDLVVVEREYMGDGRFVPVVTDLFRRSQAVLRRRMGDVLVEAEGCSCGDPRVAVAEIAGRTDDVLWLPRADDPSTSVPFFPDFVRAAVLAVTQVRDFRLVQSAVDRLDLAVEPAEQFAAARLSLMEAMRHAGMAVPSIGEAVIEPRDPQLKLRRVRREATVPVPR